MSNKQHGKKKSGGKSALHFKSLKPSRFLCFVSRKTKWKGPMNPVRQVAEKRQYNWHSLQMENVMNYSLSIWEEKETKRYPSIFWFIVCVLIFAVQNITSIRRRPKLFSRCWSTFIKTTIEMENSFQSSYRSVFSFPFSIASPNQYCR